MKVYVIISHCGLNEPVIHGVYTEPPSSNFVKSLYLDKNGYYAGVAKTTGYQYTSVEVHELSEEKV